MFHEKGTLRINSAFYHQVKGFFSHIKGREQKLSLKWNSSTFLSNQSFNSAMLFSVPIYFPRISNSIFSLPPFVWLQWACGDWGWRQQELITGTPQQTLRLTIGLKMSQPDLCQTQGRVRGERWSILWFSAAIFGPQEDERKWKKKDKDPFFSVSLSSCSSPYSSSCPFSL